MTLDSNLVLPSNYEAINSDDPNVRENFIRDLIFSLTDMYEEIADAVNGDISSDQESGLLQYMPTVTGSGGINGSESYSKQTGWYLRQGLMVDVWVDISFTGHAGTGDMQVSLPFESARTSNDPFMGAMIAGTIAYSGGYTQTGWSIGGDSLIANVLESGDGQTLKNLQMASAASLRGHIRYIGKENG